MKHTPRGIAWRGVGSDAPVCIGLSNCMPDVAIVVCIVINPFTALPLAAQGTRDSVHLLFNDALLTAGVFQRRMS